MGDPGPFSAQTITRRGRRVWVLALALIMDPQFGSATSNQVPKGSVMKIALKTDSSGNVTSATFSITDLKGNVSSQKYPIPPNVLPLCALLASRSIS